MGVSDNMVASVDIPREARRPDSIEVISLSINAHIKGRQIKSSLSPEDGFFSRLGGSVVSASILLWFHFRIGSSLQSREYLFLISVWVVHCKPVGDGRAAMKYLAPYFFRVAISNRRNESTRHPRRYLQTKRREEICVASPLNRSKRDPTED